MFEFKLNIPHFCSNIFYGLRWLVAGFEPKRVNWY